MAYLATLAAVGAGLYFWTHNPFLSWMVAAVLGGAGIWGFIFVDTYRCGVRRAKEDEQREQEHARWKAELEEGHRQR